MAGCGIQAKKSKERNRNIKISFVRTIRNVVKKPVYVVSVPRVYSCAMDDLKIIKLRGKKIIFFHLRVTI